MSKIVKLVIGLAIVAGIAVVTNPSPERHRDQIKSQLSERSTLSKVLLVGPLTAFASNYHTLGVMSYTTVNERTVSIGAFGVVVVLDKGED
ncbi:hypothetical protein C7S18_17045 [Ahniella affigens]|uniref:DUF4359 domain-containing protein n=1 Tax=Ahniella affigens TaxID=2021234 RepID=A0A2P1PVB0_9GAMM|nr:hypothetical protein [Ahniella affigens]AVP98783.1 hypothetical protein C7S18_17045 [Ahniella affigens]